MDFWNRGEYLEYIAKIHAYVLAWMPKEAKISFGYESHKGMLGYYQPEVDYGLLHDTLVTAWSDARDVVWGTSLDYFGANGNMSFQLVSADPGEWEDEEDDSVVVRKMRALEMIRFYVAKCQDMKVRGTGSMWSYLVKHC